MDKPPDIIEGEFRVVCERPKREPFWGPNASVSNALYALTLGFGMIGHKGTEQPKALLRSKIVYFLLLAIIALGPLLRG